VSIESYRASLSAMVGIREYVEYWSSPTSCVGSVQYEVVIGLLPHANGITVRCSKQQVDIVVQSRRSGDRERG
jgi:hypothetical protein